VCENLLNWKTVIYKWTYLMVLMQRCCAKLMRDWSSIVYWSYWHDISFLTSRLMQSCFIFIITRFRLVLSVYSTRIYWNKSYILVFKYSRRPGKTRTKNCIWDKILDKIIDFGQTKTSIFDNIIVRSLAVTRATVASSYVPQRLRVRPNQ